MSRQTKVVGVSLPPEVERYFVSQAKEKQMTKSEYFRYVLSQDRSTISNNDPKNIDLASAIRKYWEMKEQLEQPVRLIGLVLLEYQGRILIVSRSKKDKLVPELSWGFPGGTLGSVDFKTDLSSILKKRLSLDVKIGNVVSARVIPESSFSSEAIVALYFSAKTEKNELEVDKNIYSKHKWVKPMDVFKYFSTSTNDEVTQYLLSKQL